MNWYKKRLAKSTWVFHVSASPCNNCDIEILDLLTPRYDLERFGIRLVGSVRHADLLLLSGVINQKVAPMVKKLYEQTPKPCFVVAVGTCPASGCCFKKSYNLTEKPQEVIPIDLYIPGCPPKPEAMIDGIVKLLEGLNE